MKIRMDRTWQSAQFFRGTKVAMYGKVETWSRKTAAMRFSSPVISLASGALTVAERISTVFEVLIKGSGNILGAPFSRQCSAYRGLRQLFLQLPIHIIALGICPLEIVCSSVIRTVGMLAAPVLYTQINKGVHTSALDTAELVESGSCKREDPWVSFAYTMYV